MLTRDRERAILALRLLEEAGRNPDRPPSEGETAWIPVSGASMAPLVPDGSRLRVMRSAGGAGMGDIVVFLLSGEIVAHRVVGRQGPRFRTKGDSSYLPDPDSWSAHEIQAVAVEVERRGRVLPLRTPGTRTAAVLLAAWSGLLGAMASPLPRGVFSSRRFAARAFRFLLRAANRALPAALGLVLLPLWEPVPPAGSGLPDPPPAG